MKDKISFLLLLQGSAFAHPKSEPEAESSPNGDPDPDAEAEFPWQGGNVFPAQNVGSGYNQGGNVESGYNPGWNGGDSGYNPGGVESGYNPGGVDSGYNPGWNGGSSGYNPGGGDSGYNPGGGDSGYNPGGGNSGYNPGGGDSGYNPGGGDSGYNPGGNGFITPVFNPGYNPGDISGGSGFNPGGSGYSPGGQGSSPGGFGPQGPCASDQCCGMADNNCCLGGKQCYTYYEQECKRVDRPRCQIESSEFCKNRKIPMCRVVRKPEQTTITVEKCVKRAKRECFKYQREICNSFPESHMHNVTWQNDRLEETDVEEIEECKTVDACKIVQEVKEEERVVEKQVCNGTRTEQKQQCTVEYSRSPDQVRQQTQFKVDYQQRCFNVPRQICESNSCTTQGCVNGGSVCSSNDYTYQQRCATVVGSPIVPQNPCGGSQGMVQGNPCGSQNGNVCQEVKEAACYGPSASCQAPTQQCCRMVQEKVCQQVPVRVPVMVNITIPGRVVPSKKCDTVDVEVPFCEMVQETIKENKTYDKCEMEKKEHCVPFELPTFSVIKQDREEQIDLRITKCKKSVVEQEYCHVFPDAEVDCRERRETRRYILNKVVCDRERDAKICRTIPWSRCLTGSDQECKMVPRQRCVDSCSTNPACGKCDQLRQEGQLQGGCPMSPPMPMPAGPMNPSPLPATSSCGNFFPKDLVGAFSPAQTNTGPYSSAPSNTIYSQGAQVTSQNFVPANTLPQHMGSSAGSLPEIGDRSI